MTALNFKNMLALALAAATATVAAVSVADAAHFLHRTVELLAT